ncbi:MAG: RNA pyrophosphohydrolase [Rubrimonas sp.]
MTEAEYAALPYRSCVGVMLIGPGARVFAGQRIDNPGPAWQMPQGGVDEGEQPAVAALRELEEETGAPAAKVRILRETADWLPYDLPRELASRLWGGRYRGQRQKWFALQFLGTDADIDIHRPNPEFSRWAWMPHVELIEKIVPFKRGIYARVFAEFDDLLRS